MSLSLTADQPPGPAKLVQCTTFEALVHVARRTGSGAGEAHEVMHKLAIHMHYRTCEKEKLKPKG